MNDICNDSDTIVVISESGSDSDSDGTHSESDVSDDIYSCNQCGWASNYVCRITYPYKTFICNFCHVRKNYMILCPKMRQRLSEDADKKATEYIAKHRMKTQKHMDFLYEIVLNKMPLPKHVIIEIVKYNEKKVVVVKADVG